MNYISKKSWFGFAIYAVIFAAIILFVLKPALTEIENNKKTIIDDQKQLAANYDEIASFQKIDKDKEGFNGIKNTIQGYLPATLNSSQFIVEVEGLAKKTDIVINSVSMSAASSSVSPAKETSKTTDDPDQKETVKKKANSGTQKNEFSLSAKAEFSKSMSFIAQMEKLSRFNSISSISIVPIENSGVDVKITGNIYYEQ